ncbi:SNF2 domain-containing protein CLASSY 3-like isoform X1 [Coffea eugenioides]|uniref:SNF2 domain-containing protein CLASSY 3-like isoform X1 n=1 Tax=Coffea eugenioides TaxID=49369 RepID=UPI000F61401F|nr:SNF2 domain-containing protein CLASSY 3-like isoform X1 [Coffea eugenioides]
MEEKSSTVAKRTRAQTKCILKKMIDEYYEKKPKEKKGESEKAHDFDAMNATEGKRREELESSKVRRNDIGMVRINSTSNDEEQKGENANRNIFNRKRKGAVEKFFNDDESSGSDVRILGQEEVVEEVNLKEFNRMRRRRRRETVYSCKNDDGGNGSSVEILQEQESWSSEEGADDSDKDYSEEETGSSDTQSNNWGYCCKDNLEGGIGKDDGKMSPSGRYYIKEKECSEDVEILGKSMEDNRKEDSVGGNVSSESSLRKRKVHGNLKDGEVVTSKLSCLRPRLHSTPKSRKQESGLRTSRKCCLRVSDSESSHFSGEESDSSDRVPKKKKEGSRISKLSKRRGRVLREVDYVNILLGSMFKDDEQTKQNLFPFEDNGPIHTLLLKFRFDDEDPAPPEKEGWQKEIDNLFTEMEMCLTLPDSDFTESSMDGTHHVTATAKSQAELCLLGEHQLILEEPIGIVCKYCQIVYMEMKDIFPVLKKETSHRRDWVDLCRGDCSGIHELHFGELASRNYYTSIDAEGSVLDLIPNDIRMSMYSHQLDGFVFLWKNIVGETCIEKLKTELSDDGRGAIISHAPGTGKTCLTIVFILSLLKMYPMCRPVIIAPRSMLLTWENEFRKWGSRIPFHNFNSKDLSGNELKTDAEFLRRVGSRMTKLYSWTKDKSVLGISYKLFEQIASGRKGKRSDERLGEIFLQLPGLVVLDEGHTPRNQQSLVWKALTGVKTKRKIILSGTPFQNNFDELYNTFCLVNPKFSGSITSESCNRRWQRKSNVEKERWISLTNAIHKKSDNVVEELKAMIDPFVHVHRGSILEENLPGLKDTLVILRPTDEQKDILRLISDDWSRFDQVHLVSLISVHPSLAAFSKRLSARKDRLGVLGCSPYAGVKTKFAIELIRLCDASHEKVLVFSEFIHPLRFIMQQLMDQLKWREGIEMLYMDGKRDEKNRQSSISSLNDPSSKVKVLFASTKACSEGINLSGASRVVLLDVVWNPSVERQAISRAYRLGQKNLVYVYHLITSGTLEVEKYAQQANKDRLSELVFSSRDRQSNKSRISSVFEDKILEGMLDNKMLNDIFENIIHQPKESNVFANFNYVEHKH